MPSKKIFLAQFTAINPNQMLRIVFFDKATHFIAESLIFRCKIDVHNDLQLNLFEFSQIER